MAEFSTGRIAWPPRSFLGRLTPTMRSSLLTMGHHVTVGERTPILRQGDLSDHVFLILSGYVKIIAGSANGEQMILAVRMVGDLLGELGVISGLTRSATALACGDVRGIRIPGERFSALLQQNAEIGYAISAMMGDRLVRSNLWRLDFQSYDAHARTARVLIEVTRSYPDVTGSGWALPLSQPELASMAGVKLRTLEKELTSLERLGAIKRRYRMVQVTDMKTLFEAAKILDLPQ